MLRLILCMSIFAFISCNSNDTSVKDTAPPSLEAKTPVLAECYLRVVQKDSLAVHLVQDGLDVTGHMVFDNFEKDGSTGSVRGRITEDILKLIYRFQSEGMNSTSEVYFKITPDGLVQGTGEVKVMGDSAYYSHPDEITYPAENIFSPTNCSLLRYWQ